MGFSALPRALFLIYVSFSSVNCNLRYSLQFSHLHLFVEIWRITALRLTSLHSVFLSLQTSRLHLSTSCEGVIGYWHFSQYHGWLYERETVIWCYLYWIIFSTDTESLLCVWSFRDLIGLQIRCSFRHRQQNCFDCFLLYFLIIIALLINLGNGCCHRLV